MKDDGFKPPDGAEIFPEEQEEQPEQLFPGGALVGAPRFTEINLAHQFFCLHASDVRYVPKWGWLVWDGAEGWLFDDESLAVKERIVQANKSEGQKCNPDTPSGRRDAERICREATVGAVERVLRTVSDLRARIEDWNQDPMLVATPAGTLDLRSGELRAARREDYITMRTAVAPDPSCPCPIWDSYFERVQPDPEMRAFIMRFAGYGLTGDVSEHKMLFCYGKGRNGKSVFVDTLYGILGGETSPRFKYASAADSGMFMRARFEPHSEREASLCGARFVSCIETKKGRAFDEQKLCSWTDGTPQRARFLFRNSFEFAPVCKIWMLGNHKPRIQSQTEAVRDRILMCPWCVFIPKEERILGLNEKLRPEWPGIFARMVQGCLDWQRQGLNPPAPVLELTQEYFHNQDLVGRWLEECCEISLGAFTETKAVKRSFREFCEREGEDPLPQQDFLASLDDHGIRKDRKNTARGFRGLRLRPPATGEKDDEFDGDEPGGDRAYQDLDL